MKNIYPVILLLLPFCAFAQIIPITNPSFEDVARHSHVPRGWYDCGFPGESPPDIHPDPSSTFQVYQMPYHGNTYLGMVVRDNNTWESVSQKLPLPLESDNCYTLFIMAARSESYISSSRITDERANYNTPVVIRIYGGFDYCDRQELLVQTKPVVNTKWEEIQFIFEPLWNYTHLVIEAFYNAPTLFPYNGNVLIDDIQLEKGCGDVINDSDIPAETLTEEPKLTIADVQPKEKKKPNALPTALPGTYEELVNVITEYGRFIYFEQNKTDLEIHNFTLNGQEYNKTNKYLTFIAKSMQQFPDYRLIISVDGKDYARYTRTINLQNQLLDLGLDKDHYTVYPYNELDLRKEWLWIATDNDLLMQIVPITK